MQTINTKLYSKDHFQAIVKLVTKFSYVEIKGGKTEGKKEEERMLLGLITSL